MKWWLIQNLRAGSRLLNALTGGEGDTTFSAYSWELATQYTGWRARWGAWRVWCIDLVAERVFGIWGHCHNAWVWHREHRLFERDAVL